MDNSITSIGRTEAMNRFLFCETNYSISRPQIVTVVTVMSTHGQYLDMYFLNASHLTSNHLKQITQSTNSTGIISSINIQ